MAFAPLILAYEDTQANLIAQDSTYQLPRAEALHLESILKSGIYQFGDENLDFLIQEGVLRIQENSNQNQLHHIEQSSERNLIWISAMWLFLVFIFLGMVFLIWKIPNWLPASFKQIIEKPYLIILFPILTSIHELFHAMIGYILGLRTKFAFANRGIFPVGTVTYPDLFKISRYKRWLPLLFPWFFDTFFGVILLLFLHFHQYSIIILVLFPQILWQWLIWMQTDLYFFVSALYNITDLQMIYFSKNITLLNSEKIAVLIYKLFLYIGIVMLILILLNLVNFLY